MSREKQIEEIDDLTTVLYEANHKKSVLDYRCLASEAYNAGWRKQSEDATDINVGNKSEWISIDERLPDTTLKKLVIYDQDIGSGEIVNETDGGMVPVSEIVAVICKRCVEGKVKQFFDLDQTIDGVWANCMGVTHWLPLPEAPKMKGGEG